MKLLRSSKPNVSEITQYTNDIATMVEMRAKAHSKQEQAEFNETIRIMNLCLQHLLGKREPKG